MTTIIADLRKRIIISDNQGTSASVGATTCQKLYRIEHGEFAGGALGGSGHGGPILHVLEILAGRKSADVLDLDYHFDEDFECIIGHESGLYTMDRWLLPYPVEEAYVVTGSGSHFALGALDAGAAIERALAIACRRDPWSSLMGGEPQVMKF